MEKKSWKCESRNGDILYASQSGTEVYFEMIGDSVCATPETAREIAAELIRIADAIEAAKPKMETVTLKQWRYKTGSHWHETPWTTDRCYAEMNHAICIAQKRVEVPCE